MCILAIAVSLVALPLTVVLVAVNMPEGALSMRLVVFPEALVLCAVGPYLLALTVSHVVKPLTGICGAAFELVCRSHFAATEVFMRRWRLHLVPVLILSVAHSFAASHVVLTNHASTESILASVHVVAAFGARIHVLLVCRIQISVLGVWVHVDAVESSNELLPSHIATRPGLEFDDQVYL